MLGNKDQHRFLSNAEKTKCYVLAKKYQQTFASINEGDSRLGKKQVRNYDVREQLFFFFFHFPQFPDAPVKLFLSKEKFSHAGVNVSSAHLTLQLKTQEFVYTYTYNKRRHCSHYNLLRDSQLGKTNLAVYFWLFYIV